jgi:nucleoside-diphosphate-sugar epimerase
MKRVLVTGATGFIGARAVPLLRARGYEVHAIGRTRPEDRDLEFHSADLLDADAVRAVTLKIRATHLLHLAWDVTPGRYWRASENLDWVSASLQLARAFEAAGGRRAVFAGTCAEYQWGAPRFFEATTPCVPATLYGAAKDALRRLLTYYGDSGGLSVGWGRIFFLYGPGEKPGRLVSDAIRCLVKVAPFPTTHGNQRRDFLHVDDVAGAFVALIDCNAQGPVNIGSGAAISVRSVLDIVASEIGNADCLQFGARTLAEGEPMVIEADVTRLTQEIGFKPLYDIKGGIAQTVAWWKRNCAESR